MEISWCRCQCWCNLSRECWTVAHDRKISELIWLNLMWNLCWIIWLIKERRCHACCIWADRDRRSTTRESECSFCVVDWVVHEIPLLFCKHNFRFSSKSWESHLSRRQVECVDVFRLFMFACEKRDQTRVLFETWLEEVGSACMFHAAAPRDRWEGERRGKMFIQYELSRS